MKLFVAVTDRNWFDFLRARQSVEANFWQPSGKRAFRAIDVGELLVFKLHYPENAIVGFGSFVRHSVLPVHLAWDAFGPDNGVASLAELLQRVQPYTKQSVTPAHTIGCSLLAEPVFLDEARWINPPADWSKNIVRGKTYDTATDEGARLYQALLTASRQTAHSAGEPHHPGYAAGWQRVRLGQGAFRVVVTEAYHRRCALTGERTLPALEAAHIKPYSECGPHAPENGLLLRRDLHSLFDLGYLTVTPQHHIEVSGAIREEYENGRDYYRLHGTRLENLPETPKERPSPEFLVWHNEQRYRG